ncbi:Hypothetical predicted protein [Podarcis lilfordi]|uniref:Uncharacterized protein n=1 Tax=Podarcis lilfordi TaxID=74358 RepID=A0AA35LJ58_9SAUR|nr:Hypothetical predicted protein [Podarcis lilfordi]
MDKRGTPCAAGSLRIGRKCLANPSMHRCPQPLSQCEVRAWGLRVPCSRLPEELWRLKALRATAALSEVRPGPLAAFPLRPAATSSAAPGRAAGGPRAAGAFPPRPKMAAEVDFGDQELFQQLEAGEAAPIPAAQPLHARFEEAGAETEELRRRLRECQETVRELQAENILAGEAGRPGGAPPLRSPPRGGSPSRPLAGRGAPPPPGPCGAERSLLQRGGGGGAGAQCALDILFSIFALLRGFGWSCRKCQGLLASCSSDTVRPPGARELIPQVSVFRVGPAQDLLLPERG